MIYLKTPVVSRDAALYLPMIQTLYEAENYPEMLKSFPGCGWIPPFYLYLCSFAMHSGMVAEIAGVSVNMILSSLLVFAGYGIAFSVTGNRKCGLIAALFTAVHPSLAELAVEIQRDMSYIFFFSCSVWMFAEAVRKKRLLLWCASGVFTALAFLTRYEAAELILLFSFALVFMAIIRSFTWKQVTVYGAAQLFSFVVVIMFFMLFSGNLSLIGSYKKYFYGKCKVVAGKLWQQEVH